ncbi:flippase-like domain-containing protein [Carboxylicivirga sp. A043]|uniref:lysylphosphatidylglycerol synthase transmembrane domain-containing protein n=1 Tax=Carboxylicivirga litoralis TaxID=2816963 RepID=UPI0021CB5890|nr:lysylphosphatidylglycerol synthase transmembrane domain-containing protein [Carboxylicivirga sp. A043]MCU4155132.1 flippase-like domain-containing protein [Carboxylicivirga sp. A043]
MKKSISKVIQFILFPAIGLFIIYQLYKDQNAAEIAEALRNDVDYKWIALSIALGLLSHVSRALRWQMLIEPIEKKPGLVNTFCAVMTGYLANLVFPRMGEVSRCGVLSKYERLSFTRVVGTVVAERLTDLFMLILIMIAVLTLQFDFLGGFLLKTLKLDSVGEIFLSPLFYGLITLVGVSIFLVKRYAKQYRALMFLKNLMAKFTEGVSSIRKIENKPLFIFHTLFIWTMYFLMIYVCFYSMPATSSLGIDAGITILLTGSLGMIAPVQGGIGAWHFMVIATLKLYGIPSDEGGVFALLVHAAQNLMIIGAGLLAFGALPIINGTKNGKETLATNS